MAYVSPESGRAEIYVIPFSPEKSAKGGKWQVSNGGGTFPIWPRNGRELFFLSLDYRVQAAGYTIKGDSFVPEKPRFWSEKRLTDPIGSVFDVAPDGKRVLALLDAEEAKPETHLRVLLNVDSELRRRTK